MLYKYYIYYHKKLNDKEPFYIGIGTKTKADIKYSTYTRANIKYKRSIFWQRIVKKYGYKIEILIESNDYEYIKQQEQYFINLYGRKDLNKGSLCNLTDGGEGTKNIIISDETRSLKRLSQLGRKHSEEHINKCKTSRNKSGWWNNPDKTRELISNTKSFKVLQFNSQGVFIKEWRSSKTVAEYFKTNPENIQSCASLRNRKVFTSLGYIWIYKNDHENKRLEKFNEALLRIKKGLTRKNLSISEINTIFDEFNKIRPLNKNRKITEKIIGEKYNVSQYTVRSIIDKKKLIN